MRVQARRRRRVLVRGGMQISLDIRITRKRRVDCSRRLDRRLGGALAWTKGVAGAAVTRYWLLFRTFDPRTLLSDLRCAAKVLHLPRKLAGARQVLAPEAAQIIELFVMILNVEGKSLLLLAVITFVRLG